ncbi:hypothetical protein [Pantoea agglomerans]|uniref:hypothetical protein n=1 Tax=Enterobacter agglomerans TaxID=549 RepID=UPI0028976A1A|nr:hypothetical protein [Pantoea agglomerans]WNK42628.1 hypothetical protein RM160_23265 [Pantoea agglomerans]
MELHELLKELLEDGMTMVWFFRTYGPKDDNGNPSLLDFILDESGEEIARRLFWHEQDRPVWKKYCWQAIRFESLPVGAAELQVNQVLCMLTLGIETELALSNAVMPAEVNRRPF